MRLDKLISECGIASRTETAKICRSGGITVNGIPAKRPETQVNPESDQIVFCGRIIEYNKFTYVMLNKPDGYVSATEDGSEHVVTELLPEELQKRNLFPCGRLDKHTLGLMLLTNDGELSHRLLAPKSHVTKSYGFTVKFPISQRDIFLLENGLNIGEKNLTKPCLVKMKTEREGVIFLTEGKYHQIKRMMEVVHNQITSLERLTFGPLTLDTTLERGEWRLLTEEEISALKQNQKEVK